VTCAHVVDRPRQGATLSVGSRQAELVANGREQGRAQKIDLAVLRVSGLPVDEVLPLARLTPQPRHCQIPGWFKHAEGSYRSGCLDASVGDPFSWTEPGSSLVAQAFELSIEQEGRLTKGFSGAPAICSQTGAVFAVVATKEEASRSGNATSCWSRSSRAVSAPSSAPCQARPLRGRQVPAHHRRAPPLRRGHGLPDGSAARGWRLGWEPGVGSSRPVTDTHPKVEADVLRTSRYGARVRSARVPVVTCGNVQCHMAENAPQQVVFGLCHSDNTR
jgi:hypothetical protein